MTSNWQYNEKMRYDIQKCVIASEGLPSLIVLFIVKLLVFFRNDTMTSTMTKQAFRPPPGGGDCGISAYGNGTLPSSASLDTDESGSSHCDSMPEFVDLTIVLPDGREKAITVESR